MKQTNYLNRYTSLPVLLDILLHRHITLLSPATWSDKNDIFYIERYKKDKSLKTVLALCFATERETYHHWKVFSGDSGGVCIEFNKSRLLESMLNEAGVRGGLVKYSKILELEAKRPLTEDWPFIKRLPFQDEGEFRVLYESSVEEVVTKDCPITLSDINRITLSPWMPQPVAESVIKVIKSIRSCRDIYVHRSTLIENERWRAAIAPEQ